MNFQIISLVATTLVLLTINKIVTKKLATTKNTLAVTYLANILSTLFLLPATLLYATQPSTGAPHTTYYLILAGGIIWTIAGVFSTHSVKKADVSLREPIIATRILWVSVFGVVFLGEHITLHKTLATLLIFGGVLLATVRNRNIAELFSNGGSWAFLSAILTSIAVFIDKVASAQTETLLYTFFIFLIPSLLQSIALHKIWRDCVDIVKNHLLSIVTIAGTQAVFLYTQFKLYSLLPISTIYPILQFSSVLVILSAIIFLHERTNIRNRLLGTCIAGIGVVLFKLFS
jgi:drug/metabolite transporter (DMT)-like permease